MKPVLVWLVVLVTDFGALAAAEQFHETVDAFLLANGFDPEGRWFEEGVKLVLYVIVGGPILTFTGKRPIKISHYNSGVDGLIWLANERKQGNARTPRG